MSCVGTYNDGHLSDNARYTALLQRLACCVTASLPTPYARVSDPFLALIELSTVLTGRASKHRPDGWAWACQKSKPSRQALRSPQ